MQAKSCLNSDQETYDELTAAGLAARMRTFRRVQRVGKLLLANGPGDFYGKKRAAELGKALGRQKLAEKFEIFRQAFHNSFEPIFMAMYRDTSKPLPWFMGWNRPCEKEDYFQFAIVHFVTLASREIHFYEKSGFVKGIHSKSEADLILAALQFETPSRKALEADTKKALNDFARYYDFQAAKQAEEVFARESRPISDALPNGLQGFFLKFWNELPRLESGEFVAGANGAICPPLCYFDDKSTEQVVQVFARRSPSLARKTAKLSVNAINKTWRRLGLVRVKKPLFCTKESRQSKRI